MHIVRFQGVTKSAPSNTKKSHNPVDCMQNAQGHLQLRQALISSGSAPRVARSGCACSAPPAVDPRGPRPRQALRPLQPASTTPQLPLALAQAPQKVRRHQKGTTFLLVSLYPLLFSKLYLL